MNEVWYAIVRFFKRIFTTPELTAFERFLVAQVHELEARNNKLQFEKDELYQRILFGEQRSVPPTENLTSLPAQSPVASTRSKLEEASRLRRKEADERAEAFIREQEAKMRHDEERAKHAKEEAEATSH